MTTRSVPSSSMSNTLPWRTLATPSTPSDLSAPSIALPCGSRMPDLRVTVTRAFMTYAPKTPVQCTASRACPTCALKSRGRFFKHAAVACELPTRADEAHGRPERGRRRGDDRNPMPLLERFCDTQRAQAAAGDQQPLRFARLLAHSCAEIEDILLAHAARPAEIGNAEAVDRADRKTLVGEEA